MRTFIYLFIISSVIVSCSNDNDEPLLTRADIDRFAYDECLNIPHPDDTWEYPAYPGTKEWLELHGRHADDISGVFKELLPPDDVASAMSTEGLFRSYIDYPYANEMESIAFNGQASMLFRFINTSIGQEMIRRGDSALRLTNIYRDFNPLCDENTEQTWNVHAILLRIMAVEEIHNQLSLEEKKDFVKIALEKLSLCQSANKGGEIYFAFTCGRIMKSAGYAPLLEAMSEREGMKNFLEYWPHMGIDRSVDVILKLTNEFMK